MVILGIFALRLLTIFNHTGNPYHLMLGLSGAAGMISVLAWMNPDWLNTTGFHAEIFHWSRAVAFSTLLSAGSWLIYRLKPGFARFPAFFCYLPFILLLLLPFLFNSLMMMEVVFTIYVVSAFLIILLLYSVSMEKDNGTILILTGMILGIISSILYWMPDTLLAIPHFIIPVPLSIGGILAIIGFDQRFRETGEILDENTIMQDLQTEEL